MGKTINRGKFGHKIGRPTNQMRLELERRKDLHAGITSAEQLQKLARVDVRTVDPEDVSEYVEVGNADAVSWIKGLAKHTGNPFLFKVDDLLVKMDGLDLFSSRLV